MVKTLVCVLALSELWWDDHDDEPFLTITQVCRKCRWQSEVTYELPDNSSMPEELGEDEANKMLGHWRSQHELPVD